MKRFYNYFLSLFLLMVAGISGAMAQAYQQGAQLDNVADVTSKNILLYGSGADGSNGYLCGTGYSASLTKNCVYRFEKTSETTADGYDLYILKQVATGLYLKDYTVTMSEEDTSTSPFDGHMTWYTSDASEAMKLAIATPVDVNGMENYEVTRGTTTSAKGQDLSTPAFVLSTGHYAEDGKTLQYFGHYSEPFYSIYLDTNAWRIYEAEQPQGKEKLTAYMDAYFANNADPSVSYSAGVSPGAYPTELVEAAHAVYAEANEALNAETFQLTNAQVDDLCSRIEKAVETLQASMNPMTDGIYFIHDSRGLFEGQGNTMYLFSDNGSGKNYLSADKNYTAPATLDANSVKYLWRVKKVDGDSATIQNVLTGLYFTHKLAIDNHYGLSDSENLVLIRKASETTQKFNKSSFYIKDIKDANRACTNPAGWVLTWNSNGDPGNQWVFDAVSEEALNAVLEEAKQVQRNATLATLHGNAVLALNKGISYTPAADYVLDNDFSAEGALVRHTGDEDNTPWYCNNKQGNEGTYEALTSEGWEYGTYFHSAWGTAFTPSLSQNHYLVAELEQDATDDIIVKVAKRGTGNDFPTQFAIYGATSFDKENPDATDWKFQGLADINYTDSVAVTYTGVNAAGDTKTVPDAVGVVAMHLDGSYGYIKLAATKTLFSAANPMTNRGYFALAKLNIWEAAEPNVKHLSAELQEVQEEAPQAITDLQTQIDAASKQIAAGNATDEQIASLQAALDAFNANYPDPSRVSAALVAAAEVYNTASNNSLIGDKLAQYPTASAEALVAVINKYQNFSEVSLSAINTAVEEINNAVAAFKASILLPEAGKFYTIRSASKKTQDDTKGISYRGIVYSASNDATTEPTNDNTPIRYYRMNGASAIVDSATLADADLTKLQDTIMVADDARLVWKAVASANGQITFRNVATGMYLTGANGLIYQSTEPTPINVEGIAAETFRFNAGQDENGTTMYMNTRGVSNTIVTWKDITDENSNFFIEEAKDYATQSFFIPNVKEGQFYAGVFAVDIDPSDGYITPYQVIGVNGDKLVLGEFEDEVPGGMPIIYSVDMVNASVSGAASTVGFAQVVSTKDLSTDDEDNYTFVTGNYNGLEGVLTETEDVPAGTVVLNNGALSLTTATTTIAANGAYFSGETSETAEEGDETLDLDKQTGKALTGIDATKVIVLPAKVDVYSIDGKLLRQGVKSVNAAKNLPAGVYVIGGQKVLVK